MALKRTALTALGGAILAALLWPALCTQAPAQGAAAPAADDFIVVTDQGQGNKQARPVTISRVFREGEIPEFAQAVANGEPLATQCDVKTRWPDGSLQQAILSFWLTLGNRQRVKVQFVNQGSGNNNEAAPAAELAKNFLSGRWDAAIEATANTVNEKEATHTVTARQLLEHWDGTDSDTGTRHWLKGSVCTQLIVEDRSTALSEDFGWRTPLSPAYLAAAMSPTDRTIRIRPADVEAVGKWSFPLTAYVNAEQMQLCAANGAELTVCENGRGINGTRAKAHLLGRILAPDQGWTQAGEDKYRSLHPIFVLTFYPNWNGIKIEAILENTWATRMQDQVYRARLLAGTPGQQIWSGQIVQEAATRWHKTYWIGSTPPAIAVDHNLRYLISTGAIPSYDPDIKVSSAAISKEVETFRASDQGEPMGSAEWQVVMGATGGRGDLGLLPRWHVKYLYTFQPEMEQVMLGNGDASASAPVHFRESLTDGRLFNAGDTTPAFGRVFSIDARPSGRLMATLMAGSDTKPAERIYPVGTMTPGDWQVDMEHQPSMSFVPYLVTGDWFYLEELYFWSSFNVAYGNPGDCNFCRMGSAGYIHDSSSVRAEAWGLRTLAQTAFATPDGTPEKTYFTGKLNNNIAIKEGKYEVTNGHYYQPAPECPAPCKQTLWRYGRDYIGQGLHNPLHFATIGVPGVMDPATLDGTKVYAAASPWEINFLHLALGYTEDLGFSQVRPMRTLIGLNLVEQLQNPKFNPYLAGEYRIPTRRLPDQAFYDNWEDVRRGYLPAMQDLNAFPDMRLNAPDAYPYILKAAASYMTSFTAGNGLSGKAGYDWIDGKVRQELYSLDPTWALVPRTASPIPITTTLRKKE